MSKLLVSLNVEPAEDDQDEVNENDIKTENDEHVDNSEHTEET